MGSELKIVPVGEHRGIEETRKRRRGEIKRRFNRRGLGRDCAVPRVKRNDPTRFKIHPILFPEVVPATTGYGC